MKSLSELVVCLVVVLPIVFSACGEEKEPPKEVVETDDGMTWTDTPKCFVQEYVKVTGLSAEPGSGCVKIGCLGQTVEACLVSSRFDCSYEGTYIAPSTNFAVLDDFCQMTLVSDSDFDEQHRSGTSLADIVNFAGASPYDYIAHGYRDGYDWNVSDIAFYRKAAGSYEYGYAPVYDRLSQMKEKDFRLIHPKFWLEYLRQPVLSRTHNLTLTVTDDKRNTFTVTWQQTFGE